MSKRKATGQLTPAVTAKRHEVISADRARLFSARLKSLNQQFAEWVKNQAVSCTSQLWLDGVQNYQEYVVDLLGEFKDIVGEDGQISRQRDVATPAADTMFGTPVGAAGAGGSGQDQAAVHSTGGSTGRKSVTWADSSTALTPAAGAAANGTPNPNTKNAGHTPAPPNLGRFDAGTPGGSEMHTPQFKLPPASAAGTPADATPASQTTRSMFGSGDSTPAAAGTTADAAAKMPSSTGGFAFGSGGFGTPVTAGQDAPGKGKDSSSPLGFTFGTPATSGVATAAGADQPAGTTAEKGPAEVRAFAFGTPAAPATGSSEAAADKSSTPTFGGFGAGSSSGKPADAGRDKEAGSTPAAPPFSFGVPPSSGAAAGSSPAFGFGAASSSAAGGVDSSSSAAEVGEKSKAPAFNCGVPSSSAAAGGSSPAFSLGTPASGAAGTSSSAPSPGGFTFGVGSGAAANAASSSGVGAGSSTPPFAFGSTGAAGGGSSSTPPVTFGAAGPATAAESTPAFGAAGSTPAFGAAGSTPGFGTLNTGFGFGASAKGTPSTFSFPAPSEAAGGGGGGAAAPSAGGDADEGEPQEEKTQVQRDQRYTVLFGKTAILNMSVKNATGKWDWQNRGKGQMSVRKDTQTGKHYIFFNLDGQGKQLVMHEIRARDKLEEVPEGPAKVRMTLLNTMYDVKPAGEPGGMPETVLVYERRMCIIRFGSKEVADDFRAMVEKHKPAA